MIDDQFHCEDKIKFLESALVIPDKMPKLITCSELFSMAQRCKAGHGRSLSVSRTQLGRNSLAANMALNPAPPRATLVIMEFEMRRKNWLKHVEKLIPLTYFSLKLIIHMPVGLNFHL